MRLFLTVSVALLALIPGGCKRSNNAAHTPAGSTKAAEASLIDTNEVLFSNPKKVQSRDVMLKWNRQTLGQAYDAIGEKNRIWDKRVGTAMEEWALNRAELRPGDHRVKAKAAVDLALNAGCTDPLVLYMDARLKADDLTQPETADRFLKAARQLTLSRYHPIRKFYADRWTLDVMMRQTPPRKPEITEFFMRIVEHAREMLADKTIPEQELFELGVDYIDRFCWATNSYDFYDPFEAAMMPGREKSATAHYLKGYYLHKQAWAWRGPGFADKVTEVGFQEFEKHLRQAETALVKAWSLDNSDDRIATLMISVAIGLNYNRPQMETWFERAMKSNPGNYAACSSKLHYLMPIWHGTVEDMISFGRECVSSTTWRGPIPITLSDAHDGVASWAPNRDEYWLQPAVWTDIHEAYEKFFRLNPNAVGYRHNYARHAYRCQQWDVLQAQIDLMGSNINYKYFGGVTEFEKMKSLAAEKSGRAPSPTVKTEGAPP